MDFVPPSCETLKVLAALSPYCAKQQASDCLLGRGLPLWKMWPRITAASGCAPESPLLLPSPYTFGFEGFSSLYTFICRGSVEGSVVYTGPMSVPLTCDVSVLPAFSGLVNPFLGVWHKVARLCFLPQETLGRLFRKPQRQGPAERCVCWPHVTTTSSTRPVN